ncbi:MAG TPA: patatin-like phospholipase family protein [Sandaracinaceae bacterium LLY-WYZ-13_1]|nr:patatin-like phospholipase family protein [Sandaracinaceae bacterium LLY-WYZ-13_1]
MSRARPKMGLCLGGGGITGAMYEVGCLAALEEFFEDFSAADFDVFVGSSSGASLATVLAGGFPATRLYRALLDPADDFFPLKRHHLLRLDGKEWRRVATSVVGAARHLFSSAASSPLELDVWNELERFWDSLPAGIFTLDPYERFLEAFMQRRQIPTDVGALRRTLYLVANDLDRGERAVFGSGALDHVPLPLAICASSAVPLLFAPVRVDGRDFIDGGMGDVAHADLAAEAGCSVVLIVNPMVPVRADVADKGVPTGHGLRRRVRDKGLIWVYSQAWRLRSEARLLAGIERWRAGHPDTELLLLEPDPDDATMFMYSPMNFAARRAILEDGFVRTVGQLEQEGSPLRASFEAAGLTPKKAS